MHAVQHSHGPLQLKRANSLAAMGHLLQCPLLSFQANNLSSHHLELRYNMYSNNGMDILSYTARTREKSLASQKNRTSKITK